MSTRVLIPIEDLLFESEINDFLYQLNTIALKLRVLHVIDNKQAVFSFASGEYENEPHALVRKFAEQLSDHLPGVEIVTSVCEGNAKDEIVREAQAFDADLILMGAHGKNGIGKFLLGSTSVDVIPVAPCSVVLLKAKKSPCPDPSAAASSQTAKK